ncbi:hypothetical protein B0I72DRAFT_158484 [Yarrowia lipolytica]|uniref:YALI0E08387p n=2 Tax=Yarrowia lipolytica TaxID=4952 RepID=B5FVH3_YARLI|nr:YALI0E08387p [Yarrowia lipolytica CLIB122]RDW23105.1 hypothetical protein B0I71DRAFT_149330 [Yarrowia lipolytica]RDW32887.1 hypothetical protein B0I72DRAFT_158484 [Yarrowia lipolytica]CAR64327.1 YALI0E08387p [Yarrowia lipolytica CLIB122]SEI34702.1 YALIA101S05e08680g1_1 [Yarrowia lipolytica]VBB78967.1 Metallothionein, putative [Yarrowia lipolytica]|eukprot:XP_002143066.1 YALI0E08387p [Yarrowia lipolytica CLIB122]
MGFSSAMFGASLISNSISSESNFNKRDLVNNCCCSSQNMPDTCACKKCGCKACKY